MCIGRWVCGGRLSTMSLYSVRGNPDVSCVSLFVFGAVRVPRLHQS